MAWGFGITSFVVMLSLGITETFAYDEDFAAAGFSTFS